MAIHRWILPSGIISYPRYWPNAAAKFETGITDPIRDNRFDKSGITTQNPVITIPSRDKNKLGVTEEPMPIPPDQIEATIEDALSSSTDPSAGHIKEHLITPKLVSLFDMDYKPIGTGWQCTNNNCAYQVIYNPDTERFGLATIGFEDPKDRLVYLGDYGTFNDVIERM